MVKKAKKKPNAAATANASDQQRAEEKRQLARRIRDEKLIVKMSRELTRRIYATDAGLSDLFLFIDERRTRLARKSADAAEPETVDGQQ